MASWRETVAALAAPPVAPGIVRRASLGLQQLFPIVTETPRAPYLRGGQSEAPQEAQRLSANGTGHAAVLDTGCVWQATVASFTGAGCKLFTEDLFAALAGALDRKAVCHPESVPSPLAPSTSAGKGEGRGEGPARNPDSAAERFLGAALKYPDASFRAILLWDLLDYLPEELLLPLRDRIVALLEPGGALLALFHARPLEENHFTRYRVLDPKTLELVPGALPLRRQRVFQNRPLLSLFPGFRTARTFVGRDTLRELLLIK